MINGFLARKLVAASTGEWILVPKHRERERERERQGSSTPISLSFTHTHTYTNTLILAHSLFSETVCGFSRRTLFTSFQPAGCDC
jgi:hypothetical protein